ncbi:lysosomal alpha-glucosidase-like [Paramacrobiotus metropolitanus]|uniref:lysosomal alpha-glucosidase-like n=1 Tax=Paramacrobiotus metropolitanus TaxID=2943436 RepID=UPI002446252D|nr:lysosomal alpha-glucosidase-like [Paramacrobiotus metropolitanus]XP_055338533.1 lysosomal alpha-glucosidase-like [Paramacrobiotus metropolitanus]
MGNIWNRLPDDDDDDLILLEKRLRNPRSSKPSEYSAFHRLLIFLSLSLAFAIAFAVLAFVVLPMFFPPPSLLTPDDPVEMAVKEIVVIELERLQMGLIPLPDWVDEVPAEEFPEIPAEVQRLLEKEEPATRPFCSLVPEDNRFDCMPRGDVNQQNCEARGCCWMPPDQRRKRRNRRSTTEEKKRGVEMDVPYCFYPFDMPSYNLVEYMPTDDGFEGHISRDPNATNVYPEAISDLIIQVFMETETRLRVKITDQKTDRYEVPIPVMPQPPTRQPKQAYTFEVTYVPFSFRVIRAATGSVLFDTSATPLSFYNQFLEIGSYLPSHYIYGLGEHTDHHFMHSTKWKSFTFWTTDIYPSFDTPLYGVHPFYLLMEEDGKSHGVFLFNSNAMDVILQPAPAITYRTIGGVLDFYFFLGPTADDVVQQYTMLVGAPVLPPYWALGYHLCRWGYINLNGTKTVTERNIAARIPFDTQWNDLDYMNGSRDFTIDPVNFAGLPEFVADLHNRGMHYVIITDPAISSVEPKGTYPPFDDALEMNCLTLNASGQYIEGNMWTGAKEAYPDFTCANASAYFTKQISEFHAKLPFDGLWIDMNEPSSFVNGSVYGCPNSSLEYPPYVPSLHVPLMAGRTLCMTAQHYLGLHYNLHSTYGIFMAMTTRTALLKAFPEKRPFILSRSTFAGQGQFSAHWNGDTTSDWSHLQTSVFDILNFNLFGMPFVGADICGFMGDTTEELCIRWHQLGAFYPFSRNHNDYGSKAQDPAAFSNTTTAIIRQALIYRYLLLPHWNTLLFRASVSGSPVLRPVFFQFPDDRTTYSLDWQFLLGDSFMVSPVLTPNTTEVLIYFPENRWYDFYTGAELKAKRTWQKMAAPLEKLNVHIRGGCIVPMQVPNVTTTLSRQNPFYLGVALNDSNAASGEIFWDDGEQYFDTVLTKTYSLVSFTMDNYILTSHVVHGVYPIAPPLKEIILLGLRQPSAVILDGNNVNFDYDQQTGKLVVGNLALNFLKEFKLEVKMPPPGTDF